VQGSKSSSRSMRRLSKPTATLLPDHFCSGRWSVKSILLAAIPVGTPIRYSLVGTVAVEPEIPASAVADKAGV